MIQIHQPCHQSSTALDLSSFQSKYNASTHEMMSVLCPAGLLLFVCLMGVQTKRGTLRELHRLRVTVSPLHLIFSKPLVALSWRTMALDFLNQNTASQRHHLWWNKSWTSWQWWYTSYVINLILALAHTHKFMSHNVCCRPVSIYSYTWMFGTLLSSQDTCWSSQALPTSGWTQQPIAPFNGNRMNWMCQWHLNWMLNCSWIEC